jgi:hypothetical protein
VGIAGEQVYQPRLGQLQHPGRRIVVCQQSRGDLDEGSALDQGRQPGPEFIGCVALGMGDDAGAPSGRKCVHRGHQGVRERPRRGL